MKCLDLYWWVNLECVHDCVWVHAHADSGQKCLKQFIISFVVLISALSMWILKSPAIAKQSNSEEIIDKQFCELFHKGWRVFWRPVNDDKQNVWSTFQHNTDKWHLLALIDIFLACIDRLLSKEKTAKTPTEKIEQISLLLIVKQVSGPSAFKLSHF